MVASDADRAERLVLLVVVDAHAEPVAVTHDRADEMRQVADREREPLEARGLELPDDHVEDRPVVERQQRLRNDGGVGLESRPLATGEDDCASRHGGHGMPGAGPMLEDVRTGQILLKVLYWLAVLAISVALVIGLLFFFESRDNSSVEDSSVPALNA